jgi:hypothetical protein
MDQIFPKELEWEVSPLPDAFGAVAPTIEDLAPIPGMRLFNVAQAALVYGVHPQTILRWAKHALMDQISPEGLERASYAGLADTADEVGVLLHLEALIRSHPGVLIEFTRSDLGTSSPAPGRTAPNPQ